MKCRQKLIIVFLITALCPRVEADSTEEAPSFFDVATKLYSVASTGMTVFNTFLDLLGRQVQGIEAVIIAEINEKATKQWVAEVDAMAFLYKLLTEQYSDNLADEFLSKASSAVSQLEKIIEEENAYNAYLAIKPYNLAIPLTASVMKLRGYSDASTSGHKFCKKLRTVC